MFSDGPNRVKRPVPIHTRLDAITVERLLEYANVMRQSQFEAAYELIVAGLDAEEARRNGGKISARGKLSQLQRKQEERQLVITTLAKQAPQVGEAGLEALCEEFGVTPGDVRAVVNRAGSKAEQRKQIKDAERCKMFIMGVLTARENGLDIGVIRPAAEAQGFSYWQINAALGEVGKELSCGQDWELLVSA